MDEHFHLSPTCIFDPGPPPIALIVYRSYTTVVGGWYSFVFEYEYTRTIFEFLIQLSSPTGGMRNKTNHFVEGGDHGNREEFINRYIRKAN